MKQQSGTERESGGKNPKPSAEGILLTFNLGGLAMNRKKDRFGIDIMKTCREYEDGLEKRLKSGEDPSYLLRRHLERLRWLQHERFVHFIVTALTVVCSILLLMLYLLTGQSSLGVFCLMMVMVVFMACYIFHYFRLENTVQHWYHIADILEEAAHKKEGSSCKPHSPDES